MLIDRALFLRLGGFDERLFCYCEDVDLGYRLRLVGEPTLLVPDAVVRHVGSASTGGRRSDFAVFHGTRNRFWVFVKDTPPVLFWLTLPLHILATVVLFARHATRGELVTPDARPAGRDPPHRRGAGGAPRGSGDAARSAPGRSPGR